MYCNDSTTETAYRGSRMDSILLRTRLMQCQYGHRSKNGNIALLTLFMKYNLF